MAGFTDQQIFMYIEKFKFLYAEKKNKINFPAEFPKQLQLIFEKEDPQELIALYTSLIDSSRVNAFQKQILVELAIFAIVPSIITKDRLKLFNKTKSQKIISDLLENRPVDALNIILPRLKPILAEIPEEDLLSIVKKNPHIFSDINLICFFANLITQQRFDAFLTQVHTHKDQLGVYNFIRNCKPEEAAQIIHHAIKEKQIKLAQELYIEYVRSDKQPAPDTLTAQSSSKKTMLLDYFMKMSWHATLLKIFAEPGFEKHRAILEPELVATFNKACVAYLNNKIAINNAKDMDESEKIDQIKEWQKQILNQYGKFIEYSPQLAVAIYQSEKLNSEIKKLLFTAPNWNGYPYLNGYYQLKVINQFDDNQLKAFANNTTEFSKYLALLYRTTKKTIYTDAVNALLQKHGDALSKIFAKYKEGHINTSETVEQEKTRGFVKILIRTYGLLETEKCIIEAISTKPSPSNTILNDIFASANERYKDNSQRFKLEKELLSKMYRLDKATFNELIKYVWVSNYVLDAIVPKVSRKKRVIKQRQAAIVEAINFLSSQPQAIQVAILNNEQVNDKSLAEKHVRYPANREILYTLFNSDIATFCRLFLALNDHKQRDYIARPSLKISEKEQIISILYHYLKEANNDEITSGAAKTIKKLIGFSQLSLTDFSDNNFKAALFTHDDIFTTKERLQLIANINKGKIFDPEEYVVITKRINSISDSEVNDIQEEYKQIARKYDDNKLKMQEEAAKQKRTNIIQLTEQKRLDLLERINKSESHTPQELRVFITALKDDGFLTAEQMRKIKQRYNNAELLQLLLASLEHHQRLALLNEAISNEDKALVVKIISLLDKEVLKAIFIEKNKFNKIALFNCFTDESLKIDILYSCFKIDSASTLGLELITKDPNKLALIFAFMRHIYNSGENFSAAENNILSLVLSSKDTPDNLCAFMKLYKKLLADDPTNATNICGAYYKILYHFFPKKHKIKEQGFAIGCLETLLSDKFARNNLKEIFEGENPENNIPAILQTTFFVFIGEGKSTINEGNLDIVCALFKKLQEDKNYPLLAKYFSNLVDVSDQALTNNTALQKQAVILMLEKIEASEKVINSINFEVLTSLIKWLLINKQPAPVFLKNLSTSNIVKLIDTLTKEEAIELFKLYNSEPNKQAEILFTLYNNSNLKVSDIEKYCLDVKNNSDKASQLARLIDGLVLYADDQKTNELNIRVSGYARYLFCKIIETDLLEEALAVAIAIEDASNIHIWRNINEFNKPAQNKFLNFLAPHATIGSPSILIDSIHAFIYQFKNLTIGIGEYTENQIIDEAIGIKILFQLYQIIESLNIERKPNKLINLIGIFGFDKPEKLKDKLNFAIRIIELLPVIYKDEKQAAANELAKLITSSMLSASPDEISKVLQGDLSLSKRFFNCFVKYGISITLNYLLSILSSNEEIERSYGQELFKLTLNKALNNASHTVNDTSNIFAELINNKEDYKDTKIKLLLISLLEKGMVDHVAAIISNLNNNPDNQIEIIELLFAINNESNLRYDQLLVDVFHKVNFSSDDAAEILLSMKIAYPISTKALDYLFSKIATSETKEFCQFIVDLQEREGLIKEGKPNQKNTNAVVENANKSVKLTLLYRYLLIDKKFDKVKDILSLNSNDETKTDLTKQVLAFYTLSKEPSINCSKNFLEAVNDYIDNKDDEKCRNRIKLIMMLDDYLNDKKSKLNKDEVKDLFHFFLMSMSNVPTRTFVSLFHSLWIPNYNKAKAEAKANNSKERINFYEYTFVKYLGLRLFFEVLLKEGMSDKLGFIIDTFNKAESINQIEFLVELIKLSEQDSNYLATLCAACEIAINRDRAKTLFNAVKFYTNFKPENILFNILFNILLPPASINANMSNKEKNTLINLFINHWGSLSENNRLKYIDAMINHTMINELKDLIASFDSNHKQQIELLLSVLAQYHDEPSKLGIITSTVYAYFNGEPVSSDHNIVRWYQIKNRTEKVVTLIKEIVSTDDYTKEESHQALVNYLLLQFIPSNNIPQLFSEIGDDEISYKLIEFGIKPTDPDIFPKGGFITAWEQYNEQLLQLDRASYLQRQSKKSKVKEGVIAQTQSDFKKQVNDQLSTVSNKPMALFSGKRKQINPNNKSSYKQIYELKDEDDNKQKEFKAKRKRYEAEKTIDELIEPSKSIDDLTRPLLEIHKAESYDTDLEWEDEGKDHSNTESSVDGETSPLLETLVAAPFDNKLEMEVEGKGNSNTEGGEFDAIEALINETIFDMPINMKEEELDEASNNEDVKLSQLTKKPFR